MSTRKALFYSFLDRYSGLVISFGSSIVIARLLTPEDLGVFSVAMALLMLAATVRDMGAGQYLVQVRELTDERIRAVWTLQLGIGLALGILVAALAYPAASFYAEPRMAPLLGIMALSYCINPIGSITVALLVREMRFQHIAILRVVAGSVGAAVSISLAYAEHGPLSLAWGNLAMICTNALMAQCFRQRQQSWRPSLRGVKEALSFGGKITGTSLLNTLQSSTPDFVLGKLQTMSAAGLYSRSNGLVSIFNRLVLDAIWGVAVSALASQAREGKDTIPAFLRALSYVTVLNWVFAVYLIAFAHPITTLLYGTQWADSVPLTCLLAAGSAVLASTHVCSYLNTALGRADNALRATLLTTALAIPAVLLGAAHSLEAVGWLLIPAGLASTVYWFMLTRKLLGISWRQLTAPLLHSAWVTLGCCVFPALMVWTQGPAPGSSLLAVLLALLGGTLSLLLCLRLFRHPLGDELSGLVRRR